MKPFELYTKSGKSAGIWACGECRIVAHTKEQAEKCCKPYQCKHCGVECKKYWTVCDDCRRKADRAREEQRFEKATKITPGLWQGGMIYAGDGMGWRDGYFTDFEELEDWCASEDVPLPNYVWNCTGEKIFERLTLERIADWLSDDVYDDFEYDAVGEEALGKAIEAFQRRNDLPQNTVYTTDYSTAIVLSNKPADTKTETSPLHRE